MLGRDCWFCDKDDREPMVMDREFDTPVHISCITEKLLENPEHDEAQFMAYLLEPEVRKMIEAKRKSNEPIG